MLIVEKFKHGYGDLYFGENLPFFEVYCDLRSPFEENEMLTVLPSIH